MIQLWPAITALGDSAVLLPCALLTAGWLASSAQTRHQAGQWLLLLLLIGALVTASKIIFMAWGFGIPSLNFTGISGHSAMSAAVWPAVLAMIGSWCKRPGSIVGAVLGLMLAMAITVSRVILHAHSWAEVVAGFLVGATAISMFLCWQRRRWDLGERHAYFGLALLLLLPFLYGHRFPSERILRFVAQHASLDNTVYSRRHLYDRPE